MMSVLDIVEHNRRTSKVSSPNKLVDLKTAAFGEFKSDIDLHHFQKVQYLNIRNFVNMSLSNIFCINISIYSIVIQ